MPFPQSPYYVLVNKVQLSSVDVSGAVITLYNDTKSTSTVKTSNESDSNITINLAECGDWDIGDIIHVKATYGGNEKVSGNHATTSDDNDEFEFGVLALSVFPFNPYIMRLEKATSDRVDVVSATLKFENVTKSTYKEITGTAANSNGSYNLGDVGDWDNGDEIRITVTKGTETGYKTYTVVESTDHGRHDFGIITISSSGILNLQISLGTDDCSEEYDTTVSLSDANADVGYWLAAYDIGLRWQSVNIPNSATITSATLRLYQDSEDGTLSANIRGIDEDNTVTWAADNRPSQRTKTTATITANEANWTDWAADSWMYIDITSVVQEIVDRGGWSSNNALAIVIEDTTGSGPNYLRALTYEYVGNLHGAKLDVEYSAGNPFWYYNMLKRRN